ncbi:Pre-mRNA-splicing factor cwc22-like protein [Elsinoe fawcettii]|nr:Pre-mRNA-splicing factor cwc22-like protein [Elsinoe fawcettii]
MAAAVDSSARLPSSDPAETEQNGPPSGRKRSATSRSPSPERRAPPLRRRSVSRSPPPRNGPLPRDIDRSRALERQRQLEERLKTKDAEESKPLTAAEKQAAAKKEYERLLTMRSGGTYIPPARLKALQAEIGNDPQSKEFQRMAWEALKKSINGLINKVNVSNIKHIVPELFGENLIRGRGLFCRSIMKAQAASLPFTPIYAAMAAIVNTKLPQVGELLVNRLIIQFRKAFKRNDKSVCLSSTTFLAHLINQQVAHEMLAAQVLLLLLNKPTDDSVEIAVGLMKEVGQHLEEFQAKIAMAVYDQFRNILHEADIDKRVQYMIEVLFQIRKDKYKDYPAVKDELDLVEEEDQITHNTGLDDQVDVQDGLNIFKFDADWEDNEEAYKKLKAEILGEGDDSEEDESGSDVSSEDAEEEQREREMEIKDQTNTDLVNLRRTIYLTIMSSGGFEECTHKLLRIKLPEGLEHELPSMLVECSSQERTFNKFFGLIAERLCKLNRMWIGLFEGQFAKYYETIHRFETNRLRIIAQLFGHLFTSDAIGWQAMEAIRLNEEETTSSSRIFIKILFEDLGQGLGMKKLTERMRDDALQPYFGGLFPTDNPRNTRFSINFFTAIGMGALTEGMREHLKNIPKPAVPAIATRSPSPNLRRERAERLPSQSLEAARLPDAVARPQILDREATHLPAPVVRFGADKDLVHYPTAEAHLHAVEHDQTLARLLREDAGLRPIRGQDRLRVDAVAVFQSLLLHRDHLPLDADDLRLTRGHHRQTDLDGARIPFPDHRHHGEMAQDDHRAILVRDRHPHAEAPHRVEHKDEEIVAATGRAGDHHRTTHVQGLLQDHPQDLGEVQGRGQDRGRLTQSHVALHLGGAGGSMGMSARRSMGYERTRTIWMAFTPAGEDSWAPKGGAGEVVGGAEVVAPVEEGTGQGVISIYDPGSIAVVSPDSSYAAKMARSTARKGGSAIVEDEARLQKWYVVSHFTVTMHDAATHPQFSYVSCYPVCK